MDLSQLIAALRQPAAYPHPVAEVGVRQTHLSVVFLAGAWAYKIKKPVRFPFVDFSTLEKRYHFCQEEVRLNRRLAARVYRGVLPVTQEGAGVRLGGSGPVLEWAVCMERLPEAARLDVCLAQGAAGPTVVSTLARRLADFHAALPSGAVPPTFADFPAVAETLRANLSQTRPLIGMTLHPEVFQRLTQRTEAELERLRPVLHARAARGLPRDCHGDLRLEHTYYFPDRPPPEDLLLIDCIEFNERFRYIDPVADLAFLYMDLLFHGWRELAQVFRDSYFQARPDAEGEELLPLYSSYRAAVRGLVCGLALQEPEVPADEKPALLQQARGHWLLALGLLEAPQQRPALILVGGLPGSGKSTLAAALAAQAHVQVLRSDQVRKELAIGQNKATLYTPDWTARTYAECLRRAEELLFAGQRVLVDATFRQESQRRPFLELARRWAVPVVFFLCRARPEVIRQRLASRQNDVSDADWSVFQRLAPEWQEPEGPTRAVSHDLDTNGSPEQVLAQALAVLRAHGLQ
jgi:aminoglycoside phosphotransferase family enzyme/predicted kinase